MGKRKERRLAAMGAAGRRVKLDLFAEPSGDLGGSSGQDEVGGDDDSKNRAGLPNSPSSSGQQLENPLLLLEQYSDDELDEESSRSVNHAIVENFLAGFDDQANVATDKDCEDIGTCADRDLAAQKVEGDNIENVSASLDDLQKVEDNSIRENDANDTVDLHREVDSTEQISVHATSDTQVVGDVSSGWKMVLHEESNRYYYWNITTGETSWDVPDVLAQGTELTFEQKNVADTEGKEIADLGTHKSSSTLDIDLEDAIASQPSDGSKTVSPNCETKEIYEHRPKMEMWNDGYTSEVPNGKEGGHFLKQSDVEMSSGPISALDHETSSPGTGNMISSRQSDNALLGDGSATSADSDKYIHIIRDHGEHETQSDISCLVRHGEYLLEKLTSLKRSKGHLQGHNQISKYTLEVEIRLSDIKSLLSYGSSLLPFWLHSERQFKQLEDAINDEVVQLHESEKKYDVEASQENSGDDVKADAKEKKAICSTSEDSQASDYVSIVAEVQKESQNEAAATHTEHGSSGEYPGSLSDSGAGGKGEVDGAGVPAELTPKTVLHSGEDVDMDVEMEVEDAIPASSAIIGDASGSQYCAPPEQPILPNPPTEPEEVFGVPPPPDDDWIPPPPPDNEVFPPPPPDEPPESSFPPPPSNNLETVQPFSYAEQYNLTYPGSNFEYYGQTQTVPSSGFYALAAVPQPPLYYAAVSNTYAAAVPVVNPMEPVAYYGLQDGTVPPVPVVSGVESSGLYSASGHESYGTDQIGMVEAHAEVGCTSLPNNGVDVPATVGETEKTPVQDPFASASVQAPATVSVTQGISVLPTPAVTTTAVAGTETVPKVQSKVLRNKKRTVAVVSTLKSNKKVSSLVDKWKAAKEELHEDEEEEPENAYEILEKKRRREIEEWRAQQIASGEAKDNANFQPVRGDWRERVKRKRAQLMREAVDSPSEGLADGNQQQPDLNELSRDLPSGWQAYWDDSSKQVYYGNSATSETTWIRPT